MATEAHQQPATSLHPWLQRFLGEIRAGGNGKLGAAVRKERRRSATSSAQLASAAGGSDTLTPAIAAATLPPAILDRCTGLRHIARLEPVKVRLLELLARRSCICLHA